MSDMTVYTGREVALGDAGVARLVAWADSARAAHALAETLCQTSFCPAQFRGAPVEAAAAMLAGAEVGLSPMAALNAFDVIQGRAAPRAITLRAVALSFGHEIVVKESTEHRCVVEARRKGSQEWQRVVWTMDMATKLGLAGKDQWKKQPGTMLVARATAAAARLVAADAILGIGYAVEELDDPPAAPEPTRKATARRAVAAPEPTAAPDVAEEPTEPPATPTGLITTAQMRTMQGLFAKVGITEQDDKRNYAAGVVDHELDSAKSLTKDEASWVIDKLTADLDRRAAPPMRRLTTRGRVSPNDHLRHVRGCGGGAVHRPAGARRGLERGGLQRQRLGPCHRGAATTDGRARSADDTTGPGTGLGRPPRAGHRRSRAGSRAVQPRAG